MFKTSPGPDRERLGFKEQVLKHFNYLTEEYGFRCVEAKVTFVRYESKEVFVNVYHGRSSFELGFEIGLLLKNCDNFERKVTLSEIMELAGEADSSFCQASNKEGVEKCVSKIAGLVRQHAVNALKGDRSTFELLFDIQHQKSDRYIKSMELERMREKAEEAWHSKKYHEVVKTYEPFKGDLTPSEMKKLEYARKKCNENRV